jgi:apolipoprotein D and lipocalin family protein
MTKNNSLYYVGIALTFFSLALPLVTYGGENDLSGVTTVSQVDLNKYLGLWYEYARIPNSFQDECLKNTTATYSLREDGKLDVVNRCIDADGDTIEAKGIARVVDEQSNSKLEVSFVRVLGISLFWGDYWIIGLADDYRYAIVGHPDRKYGWILSRNPSLSDDDFDSIKNILKTQGYNFEDFIVSQNS